MMGTGSRPDLVAVWEVHLPDGIHIVEFEHGTTTGKRILRKVMSEYISQARLF